MPNGDDPRSLTLVEHAQMAEREIKELRAVCIKLRDQIAALEREKQALIETIRLLKAGDSN